MRKGKIRPSAEGCAFKKRALTGCIFFFFSPLLSAFTELSVPTVATPASYCTFAKSACLEKERLEIEELERVHIITSSAVDVAIVFFSQSPDLNDQYLATQHSSSINLSAHDALKLLPED